MIETGGSSGWVLLSRVTRTADQVVRASHQLAHPEGASPALSAEFSCLRKHDSMCLPSHAWFNLLGFCPTYLLQCLPPIHTLIGNKEC